MPRVISFIVLLAILLLVGAIFFQVMAQFIVPLFLACVLLVVFQPLHAWLLGRMPRHPRMAALGTTVLILLAVLLPLTWLGWKAYVELYALVQPALVVAEADAAEQAAAEAEAELAADDVAKADVTVAEEGRPDSWPYKVAFDLRDRFADTTTIKLGDETVESTVKAIPRFAGPLVLTGVQSVIGVLVGLAIMVLALYYFLADGPVMIRTAMYLSPLDESYEKELLERFGDVSRAVVVATLLSAVVQGALAGLGYVIALPSSAPIFLLTVLTMVTAMVPFVGAAFMWIIVCGWIYLYGERVVDGQTVYGDPFTAIVLAIYCAIVVSGIDNVIKPLVLHGQSRLHPLLALLSILGGVQVLGPVGILVGPMIVSFLQALLTMVRKELDALGGVEANGQATAIDAATSSTPATEIPPDGVEADKPAVTDGRNATSKAAPPAAKAAAKRPAPARAKRKRDR